MNGNLKIPRFGLSKANCWKGRGVDRMAWNTILHKRKSVIKFQMMAATLFLLFIPTKNMATNGADIPENIS